jgi:hypothetical protein
MPQESDELEYSAACLWLVDGYNVLRVSMPTGSEEGSLRPWWTAERRTALLELAARLPEPQAEVWVVFDGKHLTEPRTQAVPRTSTALPSRAPALGPGPRSVGCVFAPSADEWIVQALKARDGRSGTAVVTADRPLASRSRALGAEIVSTGRFVERCAGTPDVS